ncbi:hypothetical protein GN244_ATG20578 [Phytophthora infestans]|uniref:Uncharacterized protein n=1 Tax=Phytophthora infestans TaxID=4787 RepID=A0A833W348_PHYIN|nr:hypothetical protein GN244_ATG20578 [Phytophthora infestans]KAF4138618.1 hypothetical protein GN958_ATG12193 [Phytophthora infestans]
MPPLQALLLRNGNDDAHLELALLQLWATTDPEHISIELLALDDKCWRRLGMLFFASKSLVLALVAALERVAKGSSRSSDRFFQRVWQSQWRNYLHEKVVDCRTRLEREDIRSDSLSRRVFDSKFEANLVAPRLVQILTTSLRVTLTSYYDTDQRRLTAETESGKIVAGGGNDLHVDTPKVMGSIMEVVDLLLSLSTTVEWMPAIARAAAMGLHSLLSLKAHPLSGPMTTHICRSAALQHYVTWLLGDDQSAPSITGMYLKSTLEQTQSSRTPRKQQGGQHECYIELLAAAAAVAANKGRGARSSAFEDTAAMLQICRLGIASSNSNIQYSALCLLCSLLALEDASSSALSSAVRLSGILISISWLLNHSVSHIAAMAATALELIIRHSPPSDILRAVIEQGCIIIYGMLLSTSSGATKPAVAASCRSLLNWVTEEVAWQSGVVAASLQSILSSTNVLLQKNILLTLQILAQRNAAIREALKDQDVGTEALVTAIQADDEAGLSVSLLSICLNCCDKYSTLKIEGCARNTNIFQNEDSKEQQDDGRSPENGDEGEYIIQLCCADGELVKAAAALLREHTNVLRGTNSEGSQDPEGSTGRSVVIASLSKFQSSSVQHFIDLLPMAQLDAVDFLTKLQSFPTLQELLHLANTVGSAKCWHTTTSALCRVMTASNWLDIFHFASTDIRHPTLVLRCIRFGLQLHRSLGPCNTVPHLNTGKQSEADPVEKERANLATALKMAAIQMSEELFVG